MSNNNNAEYWPLVSQSMDLEDRRLQLFVRHKPSLGIGREHIVRKFLAEHTPEPFRVSTGFIAVPLRPDILSDQCDVLVYNPQIAQPLFRIDEFIVAGSICVRIAIEVRSKLTFGRPDSALRGKADKSGIAQVFKIAESMHRSFSTEVFGFGFDGPSFKVFRAGLAQLVSQRLPRVPECILVHSKNYIAIRSSRSSEPIMERKEHWLLVDFSELGSHAQGFATALFLKCYHERIKHNAAFETDFMSLIIRNMGIGHHAQWVILPDGTLNEGYDYR